MTQSKTKDSIKTHKTKVRIRQKCIISVASWVTIGLDLLAKKIKYDDPLQAAEVHGGCGAWGLLFTGLFATKRYMSEVYGGEIGRSHGLLMGGGVKLIGAQISQIIAIFGWVTLTMGSLFYGLHKINLLRVSVEEEKVGIDMTSHGGFAYGSHVEDADWVKHGTKVMRLKQELEYVRRCACFLSRVGLNSQVT
ncbi:unnamed protein product [Arabis nemorensis]|uniref:Ammonium transporter AmtB-like domain-containing protein n=1 Tax=Arabis nemorensis TaxID=586526 RepID=A0A565CA06_9BRAS|nr:unnamed protein product [Arabis nemorensis]